MCKSAINFFWIEFNCLAVALTFISSNEIPEVVVWVKSLKCSNFKACSSFVKSRNFLIQIGLLDKIFAVE